MATYPIIILPFAPNTLTGKGPKTPISNELSFSRLPRAHGAYLLAQLEGAVDRNVAENQHLSLQSLPVKDGLYLNVQSAPDCQLALSSLDAQRKNGCTLLSVKNETGEFQTSSATVYLTNSGIAKLVKKIKKYTAERTSTGTPKNAALLDPCEVISVAEIEDLWTDNPDDLPNETPIWCEVWLLKDPNFPHQERFIEIVRKLEIGYAEGQILSFPERDVVLAKLNRENFKNLLSIFDGIAECRCFREPAFFFTEMPMHEQIAWSNDFLRTVSFSVNPKVAVCILDTGINNGHQLLSPILKDTDCHAFIDNWGTHDHLGHGTKMAGVAAYGNLSDALAAPRFELQHCLASGKICAPHDDLDPQFYGLAIATTLQKIRDAAPERTHIACMAVSANSEYANRGEPTSWSAALDAIAAGVEGGTKQLIIISMGNVEETAHSEYPESNKNSMADDPAQSWNALTVGAYTDFDELSPTISHYSPVPPRGGLSPYSTTSTQWNQARWPAKPDVVFEGGNSAIDSTRDCTSDEKMSILTTSSRIQSYQFTPFWATSAATAMCANFAAKLQATYPNLWPESIRALIVHSAKWTDTMLSQFGGNCTKTDIENLRRICGYGVPSLERAMHCMENSLIMVSEETLHPFIKVDGKHRLQVHIYDLPWPRAQLAALGSTDVTLRITLSYFIEPSPGQRGWKNKFRYASHGLRFDLCGSQESEENFITRITHMNDDSNIQEQSSSRLSGRWIVGPNGRSTGSLHSDFIRTSGAELATCNKLAVFPVIGWWREREQLHKYNSEARYSLIVSLHTDAQDVDLYTPVIQNIENRISQSIIIDSSSKSTHL